MLTLTNVSFGILFVVAVVCFVLAERQKKRADGLAAEKIKDRELLIKNIKELEAESDKQLEDEKGKTATLEAEKTGLVSQLEDLKLQLDAEKKNNAALNQQLSTKNNELMECQKTAKELETEKKELQTRVKDLSDMPKKTVAKKPGGRGECSGKGGQPLQNPPKA